MTVPEYLGVVVGVRAAVDPTTGAATIQVTTAEHPTPVLLELDDEARQHLAAALGGPLALVGV